MANLYFRFCIDELKLDTMGNTVETFSEKLPHHKEIANWLPGEWDLLNPVQFFLEPVKSMIETTKMRIIQTRNHETVGVIEIIPHKGKRWNVKTRQKIWDELNAEICDGFGESYDRKHIPGTPDGFVISF